MMNSHEPKTLKDVHKSQSALPSFKSVSRSNLMKAMPQKLGYEIVRLTLNLLRSMRRNDAKYVCISVL